MATGLLYSTNTFGAACGAIVVGFVLLPIGGLDLAVNMAAGFNFLIGGFAYVLFRSCYEDYSARAG
jgi:hypothetical protein